jgi:hypothetical protein
VNRVYCALSARLRKPAFIWAIVADCRSVMSEPGRQGRVMSAGSQFDERVISVEVAECFRVYGGADGTVQVFGGGEQILGLEHAVAVADPPSVRSAGQPKAAPDSQILPVLEGVPDACDSRRAVCLALRERQARGQAAEPLERLREGVPRIGHLSSEHGYGMQAVQADDEQVYVDPALNQDGPGIAENRGPRVSDPLVLHLAGKPVSVSIIADHQRSLSHSRLLPEPDLPPERSHALQYRRRAAPSRGIISM